MRLITFSAVSLLLVSVPSVHAQPETRIDSSDGAGDDRFGRSVFVTEGRAIIGANEDDDNGLESGSAYVFTADGAVWIEEQKLTPSIGAAGDRFGSAVSMSGDWAIVAAPWKDHDAGNVVGSVYLYRFDGTSWIEEQELTPDDANALALFGYSVAIDGEWIIVGAIGDGESGANAGAAYVYRFDGSAWEPTQKLTAADGAADDRFGVSVSMSGDRAIVGAHQDEHAGAHMGSAYVFHFDGSSWVEVQKLTASDAGQFYGVSVAIDGDRAAVLKLFDPDSADGGTAYVYAYDGVGWVLEEELESGDAAWWARSVAIVGDRVVVGGWPTYVFQPVGGAWNVANTLTASDGSVESIGQSVAFDGRYVLVGDPNQHDFQGVSSGAAYGYDLGAVVAVGGVAAQGGGFPVIASSHPNPMRHRTTVTFHLPTTQPIRLSAFDVRGREVAVLFEGLASAGRHRAALEASGLPSGRYFVRLSTPTGSASRAVVLAR